MSINPHENIPIDRDHLKKQRQLKPKTSKELFSAKNFKTPSMKFNPNKVKEQKKELMRAKTARMKEIDEEENELFLELGMQVDMVRDGQLILNGRQK
jgi:hypothetical protein